MLKVLFTIGVMQVLAMIVLLARTKFLALLLGPELVGILAVIDKLVAVVVQTASISLPFAAIRFLPALWDSDRDTFYVRLRAMTGTLLGLSVLAMVIGVIITAVDPARWGDALQTYSAVLFIAFLTVPVQALVPFIQNAVAAGFGPYRSMLFYLAHAVVFAVAGLMGAWWAGLTGIYALYTVAGALLVAVSLLWLNTPAEGTTALPQVLRASFALPREVWRFGLALFALAFLAPYAALFLHYRVLSELGPQAAGWMQAAIGLSLAVRAVLGSPHAVFLTPSVNRDGSAADRMRWAVQFQRTFCLLIGVVLPPLLLFPDIAVRLLYSHEFLPGARFVYLFVLAEIVTLLAGTYQAIVLALDRLAFHVGQNLIAQCLMIVTGVICIPTLGIAGAAAASLVAQTFLYVSTTSFLHHRFSLTLGARSTVLTFYVIVAVVTVGLVGAMRASDGWTTIVLRLALYVVVVAGLALFLTREETEKLRDGIRRMSAWFLARPPA